MSSVEGRILAVHGESGAEVALVRVDAAVACPRCAAGKGCGAGVFGGRGERSVEARPIAGLQLCVGDTVRLELAPRRLLDAAALLYGLPLAGALFATGGAYAAGLGETGSAVAALLGLAAGIGASRWRLRAGACRQSGTPLVTARLAGQEG